ncbi:hypothetical protein AC249_AIPGENE12520 [Exaiptasia diaphana]|nr:hypothetical protein AC249_AIPGENE12520 [Exaiptasia diaphana]
MVRLQASAFDLVPGSGPVLIQMAGETRMNFQLSIQILYYLIIPVIIYGSKCPSKIGSDPTDVNGRLKALVSSSSMFFSD